VLTKNICTFAISTVSAVEKLVRSDFVSVDVVSAVSPQLTEVVGVWSLNLPHSILFKNVIRVVPIGPNVQVLNTLASFPVLLELSFANAR